MKSEILCRFVLLLGLPSCYSWSNPQASSGQFGQSGQSLQSSPQQPQSPSQQSSNYQPQSPWSAQQQPVSPWSQSQQPPQSQQFQQPQQPSQSPMQSPPSSMQSPLQSSSPNRWNPNPMSPSPPQTSQSPLTRDQIAVIDLKLANLRDALQVLLDFRKQNPQAEVVALPEIQQLYRMLMPIVEASDKVESSQTGSGGSNNSFNQGSNMPGQMPLNSSPLSPPFQQQAPPQQQQQQPWNQMF